MPLHQCHVKLVEAASRMRASLVASQGQDKDNMSNEGPNRVRWHALMITIKQLTQREQASMSHMWKSRESGRKSGRKAPAQLSTFARQRATKIKA